MLIRFSDPSLADDLRAHFRRAGFTAEVSAAKLIEASRPDAPSHEQERREVELHLRVWRATNPGATAELIDG